MNSSLLRKFTNSKSPPAHHIKFSEQVEKLSFNDRSNITRILRSHSETKKLNIKKGKFIQVNPQKIHSEMNDFDKEHREVFTEYKQTQFDNNEFSKKYKISKAQTSNGKKDDRNIFNELI